jgi:hypothetical protein
MKPVDVPRRMHQDRASKAKTPTANGQELRPFNSIKEVSAFLNVKVSTLRTFKKQGLLKPTNMHTNADMYSEAEVLRLKESLEKSESANNLTPVQRAVLKAAWKESVQKYMEAFRPGEG